MPFGQATVLCDTGLAIVTNRIKGSGTEPSFFAIGTGATGAARTAAVTDTALSSQSGSRVSATTSRVTTSKTNDTYQAIGSVTAGGTATYDEIGLFDAASSGNMFVSATINPISVISGDTVQFTIKVKFAN